MSNEIESSDRPDPAETLRQAAGLAQHLQRIGVQWLPRANDDAVAKLSEQFRPVDESAQPAATSSADSHPTDSSAAGAPAGQDRSVDVADRSPVVSASRTVNTTTEDADTAAAAFSLASDTVPGALSYSGPSLDAAQRSEQLERYAEQVSNCTRCEILSKCRTKTVFGEGNVNPRVVFFGEGPGRDEDLSGRPFVGKAGQLLTKMIQACKFAREDVYIMNAVKCRPPNNRNPESTEIENCREYFEAQLELLRPEYIVCLGLVGAQSLLRNKLSVGQMRGKFHRYFDSKVLVTYHPAYLLRTPAAKKAAWEDLQVMLRDAGMMS